MCTFDFQEDNIENNCIVYCTAYAHKLLSQIYTCLYARMHKHCAISWSMPPFGCTGQHAVAFSASKSCVSFACTCQTTLLSISAVGSRISFQELLCQRDVAVRHCMMSVISKMHRQCLRLQGYCYSVPLRTILSVIYAAKIKAKQVSTARTYQPNITSRVCHGMN